MRALAAHDLVSALDRFERIRHSRPSFGERLWLRALAEADEHDLARKMHLPPPITKNCTTYEQTGDPNRQYLLVH